jgi:hypothetical protein
VLFDEAQHLLGAVVGAGRPAGKPAVRARMLRVLVTGGGQFVTNLVVQMMVCMAITALFTQNRSPTQSKFYFDNKNLLIEQLAKLRERGPY